MDIWNYIYSSFATKTELDILRKTVGFDKMFCYLNVTVRKNFTLSNFGNQNYGRFKDNIMTGK